MARYKRRYSTLTMQTVTCYSHNSVLLLMCEMDNKGKSDELCLMNCVSKGLGMIACSFDKHFRDTKFSVGKQFSREW